MAGETDLKKMLATLAPELIDGEFVFWTAPNGRYGDFADFEPLAAFREKEGLTLVLPKGRADEAGISYDSVYKGITLTVHSSLDAVGLTAAFSTKLAEHGISANVIAAYFHDHIFVQVDKAEAALAALMELTD